MSDDPRRDDESPPPGARSTEQRDPEAPAQDRRPHRRGGTEARLRGLARRLFKELEHGASHGDAARRDDDVDPEASAPPPSEGRGEVLSLLGAILETGDKAKTEMVRMTAREVRNYLEALELHKDLHHLITNYSLEVHASINLKPLGEGAPPPPSASAGFKSKGPSSSEDGG